MIIRTIRKGVFETNSSSSHSITIQNKNSRGNGKVRPLIENNVLYPTRLSDYCVSFENESSETRCDTLEKKLSIYVCWFISLNKYKTISDDKFNFAIFELKKYFLLDDIEIEGESNYDPDQEYDENPIDIEHIDENQLKEIINTIEDDTIEIIDAESAY